MAVDVTLAVSRWCRRDSSHVLREDPGWHLAKQG